MNPIMQYCTQLVTEQETILYYIIKMHDTLYAYKSHRNQDGSLRPILYPQFPATEDGAAQAEAWCWEQREKDRGEHANR